MPVRILEQCRPSKWFGCKAPLTAEDLQSTIASLPEFQNQGVMTLIVPGQTHTPIPPNSITTITNMLSAPDYNKFGMFHWKKLEAIFLRRQVLEEVVEKGYFVPGQDYATLVAGIKKMGLSVVDVEII